MGGVGDESLQGAQQRQVVAGAAAAEAKSRTDAAAAAMGRRVQALTSEFLAEIKKLGNPGAVPLDDYGVTGWHLAPASRGNQYSGPTAGIALTTDGTWLQTTHNAAPVPMNPADCFEAGPLFPSTTRQHELDQRQSNYTYGPAPPIFHMPGGRKGVVLHVDAEVLESPESLAAHYLAALLTHLPTSYPTTPPPPTPSRRSSPQPPPGRWWQRPRTR